MAIRLLSRRRADDENSKNKRPKAPGADSRAPAQNETVDVSRLLAHGRHGTILAIAERCRDHPQMASVFKKATAAIDRQFNLVPEGCASLPQALNDSPGCPECDIVTGPFVLARCAVSNAEYQSFVDAGGYDELDLWPQDLWPHLIDFGDQTGDRGPRFWAEGRHPKQLADHPVVGISFYEAQAYAKWAGYRLPTEAEWQVAASWRIRSSAYVLRRYPWGDAMDTGRCNIWATGISTTVPVTAYPDGAAPNGILQLGGNVWEWTASEFEVADESGNPVIGDMRMTSVRGGAFDTYFPAQASSCFEPAWPALRGRTTWDFVVRWMYAAGRAVHRRVMNQPHELGDPRMQWSIRICG